MKKTILCSFLTVLVIGYSEESSAYGVFGLNATTQRANDALRLGILNFDQPGTSLLKTAAVNYLADQNLPAMDDESLLINEAKKMNFSNQYLGSIYDALYQESFANLQIATSNAVSEFYNPHRLNKALLSKDEFMNAFVDQCEDADMYPAIEQVHRCLERLHKIQDKYSDYLFKYGGTLGKVSEENDDALLATIAEDWNELKSIIEADSGLVAILETLDEYTHSHQRQETRRRIERIRKNIEQACDLYSLANSNINARIGKARRVPRGDGPYVKELLKELGQLEQNLNQLLDRSSFWRRAQLGNKDFKTLMNKNSDYQRSVFGNQIVPMEGDDRYEYILNYGNLGPEHVDQTIAGGIFEALRNRETRDQFRIRSGMSWKDVMEMLTYDLYVANIKNDLVLKKFLNSVLLDTYDDPRAWVPADKQEALYANETARRLSFLMFGGLGGVRGANLGFRNRNNATESLEVSMHQIHDVVYGGRKASEAVVTPFHLLNSSGSELVDLFELGRADSQYRSAKLQLETEVQDPEIISSFGSSFSSSSSSGSFFSDDDFQLVAKNPIGMDFVRNLDFVRDYGANARYALVPVTEEDLRALEHNTDLLILHDKVGEDGEERFVPEYHKNAVYRPTVIVHERDGKYTLRVHRDDMDHISTTINFANLPAFMDRLAKGTVELNNFLQARAEDNGDDHMDHEGGAAAPAVPEADDDEESQDDSEQREQLIDKLSPNAKLAYNLSGWSRPWLLQLPQSAEKEFIGTEARYSKPSSSTEEPITIPYAKRATTSPTHEATVSGLHQMGFRKEKPLEIHDE